MKGSKLPDIDFTRLSFPPADLRIVRRNGIYKVYDPLRKGYFCLTPEELIRQLFVAWIIKDLGYPPSLLANEIGIKLNDTVKRCDTVLFSSSGSPLMILEYKAPNVVLTQEVFNQIVRYNMSLKADYLVVSNGYQSYCCKVNYQKRAVVFLPEMPSYLELKESKF